MQKLFKYLIEVPRILERLKVLETGGIAAPSVGGSVSAASTTKFKKVTTQVDATGSGYVEMLAETLEIGEYDFELVLHCGGNGTGGLKLRFVTTATGTYFLTGRGGSVSSVQNAGNRGFSDDNLVTFGTVAATSIGALVKGTITVTTNNTNFSAQIQSVTAANIVSAYPNSFLKITKR